MTDHLANLQFGNARRLAGLELRRDLRDGTIDLAGALEDDRSASLTIYDLLIVQRFWGRARTVEALRHAGIYNERKRVPDLTRRQREALVLAARLPRPVGMGTNGEAA